MSITAEVEKATKNMYERFKYVSDSSTAFKEHTLTSRSLIRQKATRAGEDDFFYDGMLDINIYNKAMEAKPPKGT